jgi:hypothetical protein
MRVPPITDLRHARRRADHTSNDPGGILMGKVFGILLVVVGIWLGLEVYQKGTQEAFGGALASLGGYAEEQAAGTPRTVPQRAGADVERAHAEAQARFDRMLGE